jgi:hypothetical protein
MTEREELLKAAGERHSVRSYTAEPISASDREKLLALIAESNTAGHLHLQLIENDPTAFTRGMAHYGKFSGVTNYIALVGRKSDSLSERLGYYGESIVLHAQLMGLNTCWVGLTFKRNPGRVDIGEGEVMKGVIAIGHGATQGVAHKVKAEKDVMRVRGGEAPAWFTEGVRAALLAPTAVNQQKFRFTLIDGKVKAEAGWGFFTKMDLGIARYHFELGAGRSDIWL